MTIVCRVLKSNYTSSKYTQHCDTNVQDTPQSIQSCYTLIILLYVIVLQCQYSAENTALFVIITTLNTCILTECNLILLVLEDVVLRL